ncbi:MAG: sensor histidine kinase [Thermomicrobiales bacterium]|nr:sensor histidine kinase [Thermomicrobiales bacterium]
MVTGKMSIARAAHSGSAPERILRQLGGVSLFYKVLLANGTLVLGATLIGMDLADRFAIGGAALNGWGRGGFAFGVTALSLLVNALVLRAAFLPLQRLERTADAVRRGDYQRRAPYSMLNDPTMTRLTDAFNAMLAAQEENRAALAALSSRTLDAQEEERRRIARELHDETAQELTALLVRIRLAADGSREPATRDRLAELRAATARVLDGVRRLARELRPTILDDLGLVEAVRAYAQEASERNQVRIDVRANFTNRLDPPRELVLYRVVQEALSNVMKHANARLVEVTLDCLPTQVTATVTDNGRGFDPAIVAAPLPTGQGLGLLGMRERLSLVGGRLVIEARPGYGTLVRAAVPLPPGQQSSEEQ